AEGGGLFSLSSGEDRFTSYRHDSKDPSSLASFAVTALLVDHNGTLWIGTKDSGLESLAPGRPPARFVHHRHAQTDPTSLSYDDIRSLAEDGGGNIWVATYGGGLDVLDSKQGIFRHHRNRPGQPRGLPSDVLTCVFVDRSGTLWIGTDGAGLSKYDSASDAFITFRNSPGDPWSLSRNVVRAIYEDSQTQLWVGTFMGGVNLLKKSRPEFAYWTHDPMDPSSLSDPAVACFLEDAQGQIWLGTEQGWLNRFDARTGTFVRYRFPSSMPGGSAILSLHEDRRGRIWAGSYRGGLGLFDPGRGTFKVFKHQPGDLESLTGDEVWAIAEDGNGALWLGTNDGLDQFDPDRGKVTGHLLTPSASGLSYSGVRALLFDRNGTLWTGSWGGLSCLHRGEDKFIHFHSGGGNVATGEGLSNSDVAALHEDRLGRMWIGTVGGGLNLLDPAKDSFTSYQAFPSNFIYGIQEDASGRLWLSTNHGLSRFTPSTGGIENFDLTNGLQSLQFHPAASLRTRSGRLLFGSTDGFYSIDPEAIKPATYAPPVVLTSLRVFNEQVKLPAALSILQNVTLPYEDKIISVEFAALDYTLPRRNHYSYLMEGFSNQWIDLGTRREVTFTNLDPGSYVLRVRGSNSDGVWNQASTIAFRITITPPFWRKWWFRGLLAALLALGLLGVHRFRVRWLTADLMERKRSETALRQAEEKYRGIFENAMEGIFQSIPGGGFISVNPAMAQMYGYATPDEMVREVTNVERQLYADPGQRDALSRTLESDGGVRGFEIQNRRKDGTMFWASVTTRPVRDIDGSVLYYEGIHKDITERRQA
ncbi:MAG TPA: two-component regulator propeller domain-containing protein, partial [Blastocatellia bacterium]|nr:two-component regulator propeller domain-containing protein [Blastocatellia bacterium]